MIDWQQVNELREDMGDGFDEIVEVFLHEVEDALNRLAPSMGNGALAADLHFLKGAALNLGFRDFAGICADGEDRAVQGAGAAVDIAAIRHAYAESRQAFSEGLKRDAA
jgi:histidine phosphotransfer protein HptB